MSPLIIKGLVAAGGLGSCGIGIWQITNLVRPKTIGERLTLDGVNLMGFDESLLGKWAKVAKKYVDASSTESSNKFNGLDITSNTESNDDGRKLMEKCRDVANKKIGGDDYESDVNRLKAWCVESKATDNA